MHYDIMFFEALGEENAHIHSQLQEAMARGTLPRDLNYYVGTETLQEYTQSHPGQALPDILSTKTHSVLPETWLLSGKKKCVISRSAGYDHFEHLSDLANITCLRNYCVNAVAETAVKLMFCACGNLNQYTQNALQFERNSCISFKELSNLRVTVFGAGMIGKRIYDMVKGLGMDARAVDLRQDTLPYSDVNFISREAATDSDVIICAMNYTKDPASRYYNEGYFSEEYLRQFPKGLVFVNVTRGEIAPEAALLKLFREGHLFGIGVDAFYHEAELTAMLRGERRSSDPNCLAAQELIKLAVEGSQNIYVQPHQGFNSDVAAMSKARETVAHLEDYYARSCVDFSFQLPFYV